MELWHVACLTLVVYVVLLFGTPNTAVYRFSLGVVYSLSFFFPL